MESLSRQTPAKSERLVWIFAVLFFVIFSYLIPKTCDDWIFTARLMEAPSRGGLFGAVLNEWYTLNGRLLGNGLSIALAGSKLLRTLCKAAVYAAILFSMARLTRLDRRAGFGLALTFLCMMLVPAELRKQTYAWDSGFVNYAVPMALLLCYLLLIRPLFDGKPVRNTVSGAVLALLLGVSAALFVENLTAYALLLGLGTTIWHLAQARRVSLTTVCFLVGAFCGTALMLSSPTYATTLQGGDAYRAIPTTLPALLMRIKSNYQALSCYSFGQYTLLHLLLSGSALVLLFTADVSGDRRLARLRKALMPLICALPVYFYLSTYVFDYLAMTSAAFLALSSMLNSFYLAMALDLLCYGLYVLSFICVLLFFVKDAFSKRFGLTCIVSALASAAPMLFVWPIDYRCFLPSYLFWACVALLFCNAALSALPTSREAVPKALARCAYATMAVVCLYNLTLYATCPKLERTRTAYLAQQMRIHASVIVLPEFECEGLLHYPTVSIGDVYHYEAPGDIEMPFIPYSEWRESFSFGLSAEDLAAYENAPGVG